MLLVLALSLVGGPQAARWLQTAPALLISNLHRLTMFRKELNPEGGAFVRAGGVSGSLLGGLFAARVPEAVLQWIMVGMAGLAVTRALNLWSWKPRPALLMPAGAGLEC
ncbi:MAG: hypothetical protein R3B70_26330 [Polyangiaceae bacterium]